MKHRFFGAAILLIIVWPLSARAQNQFGIEFGEGFHSQSGEVWDSCGCNPGSGLGSGLTIGILGDVPSYFGLRAGIKARLDYKKTSGSDVFLDSVIVQSGSTGQVVAGRIPLTHRLDITATYLSLSPYLSYEIPNTGLYFQFGPSVSDLLSSQLTETRSIKYSTVTLNGQAFNNVVLFNGSNSETTADGPISYVNQWRVSALISAGYEIPVGRSTIGPVVSYDYPLTTIRSVNASNWKISSIYGTIVLKFGL